MADDDDDAFSFGDFTFALPPQSQSQSQAHINGVTSTSINKNNNNVDNLWGNFLITPHLSSSLSSSSSQSQFKSNNGFSSNPTNLAQPTPLTRADPGPNKAQKPKGALPLSLFGEVEDEDEDEDESKKNNSYDELNKWVDSKSQNGKFGVNNNGVLPKSEKENGFGLNLNGVAPDLIVDDHKKNNDEVDDDDDEWEFKGAFSNNGGVKEGNFKDESVVSGSKFEPFAMAKQEKQAGQDTFSFADTKPGSISFAPQSIDFFALSNGNGSNHQSSGLDVGFNSTTSTINGFMWDPFSGVESIGNGSGINASVINQDDDGDDDFGDFVDASQEVASKGQQGQVIAQTNLAEAQIPNDEIQEKQTQTEHSRGALPLSFFSDATEESSDGLDLQNEVVHKATLSSGNSFSGQGSAISINDLISNLYSQAQLTSPVNTTGKPAENGVHSPQKAAGINLLGGDDDWDDGSWEFNGAISENGVREQLSTAISEKMSQKQAEIFPELRDYMEFYDSLKNSLCFLLSCQLEELKKAQNSDAVTTNGGKSEATDDEIQEAFNLLEESVNSKDELAKKNLQRDSCLNKLLEVLQGPKFNVIESDFQLSKRLHLAEKEWRVAAELLRHAISMLKILLAGSTDEQSHYASTWSKIIDICVQELRHGASIWKRASEKNVKHQLFSNSRGQQNILALGEIYKVMKLLGLSAKVYGPIILPSASDSSQFFGVLDECDALWSSIGLEELFQSLSDNDFGFSESAGALIVSIKNIHAIDVFALHNCIFIQRKPTCQLSLLPQDMLDDLKTVMWGEKAYFLNLANLWANLISCEPPKIPQLQVY